MSKTTSAAQKAFKYLSESPKVTSTFVKANPGSFTARRKVKSNHNKAGQSHRELQGAAKPPLGWVYGDWYQSWFQRWPSDWTYNKDIHLRREYPPISLLEVQRLIDLGFIDPKKPIDLTTLCNTKQYKCDPIQRQFGVQLTDEGADIFAATVNIEVQWASETAISAIERNGGKITCSYYDPIALNALVDPIKFFSRGEPIPRRAFPPIEIIHYYVDPRLRGYLCDPSKLKDAQTELAQKFGHKVPDYPENEELFLWKKDPLQVFHGLQPGWVVNLKDECILKPKDEKLQRFYDSLE